VSRSGDGQLQPWQDLDDLGSRDDLRLDAGGREQQADGGRATPAVLPSLTVARRPTASCSTIAPTA
jgi:hypothetical protein